ncbi:hypothetical protein BDZ94DRAFT_1288625 [Collybia nuda]|uniref:EthD domain-containing protein n=1 Tax=Collybia nuda TaxID=64659 RepID=A0A9P5YC15_9AGAR|nr:hypothetical protein BDZ94DRAFT_1288625 [Collybia nuda]
MPLGFLVVFSEPGEKVSINEFQDWYNNEHVPLRMNYLSSFLTGARFSAADDLKPSWLALYDVDDTSTFEHESYTRLRANRSPREADLVKRLSVLDRRTCEFISDSGESSLTTSFASKNPTKAIVTHGVQLSENGGDQDFRAWTQEFFERLKTVEGWVRTRTYKCIDNLKTGVDVGEKSEEQVVPTYLVLTSISVGDSSRFQDILHPPNVKIMEVRSWNLYKAYPGIAQENIES